MELVVTEASVALRRTVIIVRNAIADAASDGRNAQCLRALTEISYHLSGLEYAFADTIEIAKACDAYIKLQDGPPPHGNASTPNA